MDEPYLRIGALSERVGVSPELLRAWEQRYGLLQPLRSDGGFRLYSSADEQRVRAMRRHLDAGVSAAQAARLALAETLEDEAVTSTGVAATRASCGGPRSPRRTGAHAALDRLLASLTIETVLRDVLLPYLRELGERWERGEISVAQEHFASNVLRGRLLGLARGWGNASGPTTVLACAPGELHDLPLLMFGLVLAGRGRSVTYLGPDTPVATIQEALATLHPGRVVITATTGQRRAPRRQSSLSSHARFPSPSQVRARPRDWRARSGNAPRKRPRHSGGETRREQHVTRRRGGPRAWSQSRGPTGAFATVQRASLPCPAVEHSSAGARRLGDLYWHELSRSTFGLVRARVGPDAVMLTLPGIAPALLRFGRGEPTVMPDSVTCRTRSSGGSSPARRAAGSRSRRLSAPRSRFAPRSTASSRGSRRGESVAAGAACCTPTCRPDFTSPSDGATSHACARRPPDEGRRARRHRHGWPLPGAASGRAGRCRRRLQASVADDERRTQCRGRRTDGEALGRALEGVDVVYYLVHSLGTADFRERDRIAATTTAREAERAGVRQIVYLGGLGDESPDLSPHLKSRAETAKRLASGSVPVTTLRAAMVIGPGSAAFETIVALVDRLPA